MSLPLGADTRLAPNEIDSGASAEQVSDRRADVEAKQARIAALLAETGCDALLVLEPENFTWLTSGATARGTLDPAELPALLYTPEERWLLTSNVDSQRLFDEELDGMGFQLKEWPWHLGRERLLAYLAEEQRLACDRALGDAPVVGERLQRQRRLLSRYEQVCVRHLGQVVSHALEASCRTLLPDETERQVAGQLAHRLIHRGAQPVQISVAADGRSRHYRQPGYTATPIRKYAVLTVTARKYGLCVTANRSVTFGPPEHAFRVEHDVACKVAATYLASTWPDAVPREVLATGRRVYQITRFDNEWVHSPQGHITGRSPVELSLLPSTEDLFEAGWCVTWRTSAGAASSCDTFLIREQEPEVLTPPEAWPLKLIRIQGAEFVRPDLLQR